MDMISPSKVALLLFALAAASSCKGKTPEQTQTAPAAPSAPAPAAVVDARLAEPVFEQLVVKSFLWELGGYDVLVLNKEGQASYVAPVPVVQGKGKNKVTVPIWHRIDWQPQPEQIDALVKILQTTRFRALDEQYVNKDVEDGQSVDFILTDSNGTKRVHCGNLFPPEIKELEAFLYTEFLRAKHDEIKTAPALTNDEAKAFWDPL